MVANANRQESVPSVVAEPDPQTRLIQRRRNRAAIDALRSWRDADDDEQRETWEYLRRVLDEDRPSYRKLFS
jgi:hypothetical protein